MEATDGGDTAGVADDGMAGVFADDFRGLAGVSGVASITIPLLWFRIDRSADEYLPGVSKMGDVPSAVGGGCK